MIFGVSIGSTTGQYRFLETYLSIETQNRAGEHHRRQRKLLNPVFHVNHMRSMAPLFYSVIYRVCPSHFQRKGFCHDQ